MSSLNVRSEILSLVKKACRGAHADRNVKIVSKHKGFDGGGGCPLEKTGEEHGLTRERVRQVVVNAQREMGELEMPVKLLKAAKLINSLVPASADRIESALQDEGLITNRFKIEGIINAINMVDATALGGARIEKERGVRFVVLPSQKGWPKKFLSIAGKTVSHNGTADINSICAQVHGLEQDRVLPFVKDVIEIREDICYISEGRRFFFLEGKTNCVLSRVRKIFVYGSRAHVSNVLEGIKRSWHKDDTEYVKSQIPEVNVLKEMLIATGEFVIEEGDWIVAIANKSYNDKKLLRPYEIKIAKEIMLGYKGREREKRLEDAVVRNISKKQSFSMALNYSPILFKEEYGVYRLVVEDDSK
ncbi:hypothetical protein [Neptuniibacter sp. QD37_11]|uniref:hypothetical protein n=1 Tax=Neptuniibacter sp. QD37_11 TaxID=3398209 RepID=UPI0039F4565E